MILFAAQGKNEPLIYLALKKEVLPYSNTNAKSTRRAATLINHRTEFRFLGITFDDNYSALGAVSTIVDTYLRRGFENHQNKIETIAYTGEDFIRLFGTKIPKENRKPFLRLSTDATDLTSTLTPVQAAQFHDAIKKAANWTTPESTIST